RHLARRPQSPVEPITPRMVRTGEQGAMAARLDADPRPAVAADIGQGVQSPVLGANHDCRFSSHFGSEPVAELGRLARKAGADPAIPEKPQVGLEHILPQIKTLRQAVTGPDGVQKLTDGLGGSRVRHAPPLARAT